MDFVSDTSFILLREFAKDIMKFALLGNGYAYNGYFEKREDWVPDTFEFAFGQAVYHYRESHIEKFEEIFQSYHDLIFDDETTLLEYIKFGIQKVTKGDTLLMDFLRIMAFYVDLVLYCQRFDSSKHYVGLITDYLREIYNYAGIKEVLEFSGSYGFLRRVGEEIVGERMDEDGDAFADRISRYRTLIQERSPDERRVTFAQWENIQTFSNLNPPSETGRLAIVLRKLAKVSEDNFGQNRSTDENNRSKNNLGASNYDINAPSTSGTCVRKSSSTSSDEESSSFSGERHGEEGASEVKKPPSILKSPYKGIKRATSDESTSNERKRTKMTCSDESCETTDSLQDEEDPNILTEEILIPISDPISDELRVSLDKILEEILNYNKTVKERAISSIDSESTPDLPEVFKLDENEDSLDNMDAAQVIRKRIPRGTRACDAVRHVAYYVTLFGYSEDAEGKTEVSKDDTTNKEISSEKDVHERMDSEKVHKKGVSVEGSHEKADSEKEMNEEEMDEDGDEMDEYEMDEDEMCEDEDSDNTNNTKYWLSSHSSDEYWKNYQTGDESYKRNTDSSSSENSDNLETNLKHKNSKQSETDIMTRPEIPDTNSRDNENESQEMNEEDCQTESSDTKYCLSSHSSDKYWKNCETDNDSYNGDDDSSSSDHSDAPKNNFKKRKNPKQSKNKKMTRTEISDANLTDNERESKKMKMDLDACKIDSKTCENANQSDNSLNDETSGDLICDLDGSKNVKVEGKETYSNDYNKSSGHPTTSINVVEDSSEIKNIYIPVDSNIDEPKRKKSKMDSNDSSELTGSYTDITQLITSSDSVCESDVFKIPQAVSSEIQRDSDNSIVLSKTSNNKKPGIPSKFATNSDLACHPDISKHLEVESKKVNVDSSVIEKKFDCSNVDDNLERIPGSNSVFKSGVSKDIEVENVQKNLDSGDDNILFINSKTDSSKIDNPSKTSTDNESDV